MAIAILVGIKPDGTADVLDIGVPSKVYPQIKIAQHLPDYREIAYYARPERTTRTVRHGVVPIMEDKPKPRKK